MRCDTWSEDLDTNTNTHTMAFHLPETVFVVVIIIIIGCNSDHYTHTCTSHCGFLPRWLRGQTEHLRVFSLPISLPGNEA